MTSWIGIEGGDKGAYKWASTAVGSSAPGCRRVPSVEGRKGGQMKTEEG